MSSVYNQTPENIVREIERTRQALDDTLDALQARLSPRERLEEAVETTRDALDVARESGKRIAGDVQEMIRRDPVPFLVIGGVVLAAVIAGVMMRDRRRHSYWH